MRRIALILLSCLGLLLAPVASADAAKPNRLSPVEITRAEAFVMVGDPASCLVGVFWTEPDAPRGYTLTHYELASSSRADADWNSLPTAIDLSSVQVANGASQYFNVRAVLNKWKQGQRFQISTPWGPGVGSESWSC